MVELLTIVAFLPILGLVTRLTQDDALKNGRRRLIYHYISSSPGCTFREICRSTGIAPGTVHHHLTVLKRSELLWEHSHLQSLRYFEKIKEYERNWEFQVLLREPASRIIYRFICDRKNISQSDLSLLCLEEGIPRSTMQTRLKKLESGNLVAWTFAGRSKLYYPVETVNLYRNPISSKHVLEKVFESTLQFEDAEFKAESNTSFEASASIPE